MLEKFLQGQDEIVDADYVVLTIDVAKMKHGEAVANRLRTTKGGGIPWMAILSADGQELATSDGPQGNCGYPLEPHEIEHFLNMLRTTAKRITEDDLAKIQAALDDYRVKRKARQN